MKRELRERAENNLANMRVDEESDWHLRLIESIRKTNFAPKTLTPNEKEALQWLSYGLMYQEIADAIDRDLETVKTLLAHARQKLMAKNSAHAIAIAMRDGLIK